MNVKVNDNVLVITGKLGADSLLFIAFHVVLNAYGLCACRAYYHYV